MNEMLNILRPFFSRLHNFVTRLIHFIFVFAFYCVGIGPTRIVSWIFGKRFLITRYDRSSWEKVRASKNMRKQY